MITFGTTALLHYRKGYLLGQSTKPQYAGKWMTPGGRVELYEPSYDAICREIHEETGQKPYNLFYEFKVEVISRELERHWVFDVYSGAIEDYNLILKSDFIDARPFSLVEVRTLYHTDALSPVTREALKRLLPLAY